MRYIGTQSIDVIIETEKVWLVFAGESWPNLGVEEWKIFDTHPHSVDRDLSANWSTSRLDFALLCLRLDVNLEARRFRLYLRRIWTRFMVTPQTHWGTIPFRYTDYSVIQLSHKMNAVNFILLLLVSLTHLSLANNFYLPRSFLRQRSQRMRGKL